ncbi:hypothetical protein ACFL0L_02765 [Patescibacteria group bacterium]
MKKIIFLIIIVALVVIGTFFLYFRDSEDSIANDAINAITGIGSIDIKEAADQRLAISKAKELWRAYSFSGEDLSDGPCLSNEVIPGWVADVVHDPRQAIDNDPANQCSAYRSGEATHFVELDIDGNLIRAE